MAPRTLRRRPAPFAVLPSLVALVALAACLRDAPEVSSSAAATDEGPQVSVVSSAPIPPPPHESPTPPTGPNETEGTSGKPGSSAPLARLAAVDRAGTLHVLAADGTQLATREGRATDVVSAGATIATFEPATSASPGAVRIFTLSGSDLSEAPARPITSETGGLVAIVSGTETVIAWEEAERASLIVVDAQGTGGVAVGSPASIRQAALADGSASLEVLVTASGAPRIDRFRLSPSGQLRPEDDFPVALPPDVEARMVAAPDARLLVSLEAGAVLLRDEAGGEEQGPSVAAGTTLEDVGAHAGRLALLLRSPASLAWRDLDGVYTARPLPEPLAWDPRPSHRLALDDEAVYVIAGPGLTRLAWAAAETTTTADEASELLLGDAVAVVLLTTD